MQIKKSARKILEKIASIGVNGPGDGKYDEYLYGNKVKTKKLRKRNKA